MHIKNVEFKARVDQLGIYENKLLLLGPVYQGMDHQVDTYFNVPKGRLKLREGTIENALINYERENTSEAKKSDIILYKYPGNTALKDILTFQLGVKIIVDKKRKIYFLENVKFHFDIVENLGTFIEVEAIDTNSKYTSEALKKQCDYYFGYFELNKSQLIEKSYSDLLEESGNKPSQV